MKFFIDANLPFKLSRILQNREIDVLHTDNLPGKEKTSDIEIRRVSVTQNRIIITKDSDFLDSHFVTGIPKKLLFVSTGNIINRDLFELFDKYFEKIIKLFEYYDLIELSNSGIIVHEK